jgi:hypothetical protein
MRRIRLLGLALLTFMALGVIGASVASAEELGNPEILPVPTVGEPLNITSIEGKEPFLETTKGSKISCKEVKGSGSFTSRRLGVGTLHFTGKCESKGIECLSEGDVAGTILLPTVDWHLVDLLENNVLTLGLEILPLPQPFLILCGVLHISVTGSALGLVLLKDLQKSKHFEVHFDRELLNKAPVPGEQFEKECILDKEFCEPGGKPKKFLLEANFGKSELAAEVALVLILTEKEFEVHF